VTHPKNLMLRGAGLGLGDLGHHRPSLRRHHALYIQDPTALWSCRSGVLTYSRHWGGWLSFLAERHTLAPARPGRSTRLTALVELHLGLDALLERVRQLRGQAWQRQLDPESDVLLITVFP